MFANEHTHQVHHSSTKRQKNRVPGSRRGLVGFQSHCFRGYLTCNISIKTVNIVVAGILPGRD